MQLQLEQVTEENEARYVLFIETQESLSKKCGIFTEKKIGLTMNKLYPLLYQDNNKDNESYIINNKGVKHFGARIFLKSVLYR